MRKVREMLEDAKKLVHDVEESQVENIQISLSEKDSRLFLDVIENPREPNANLVSAVRRLAEDCC